VVVVELVLVKSLVTVLVDRQVSNGVGPVWKSVGGEETGEKHERNNKYGGQGNSNLLVGEGSSNNHSVSSGGVKDKDQGNKEEEELLSGVVETNREVGDGTEDHRQADAVGKLREDLSPEVRGDIVHVVVNFSQENGSLFREDQDDILDSDEKGIHSHEEKRTLNVLPTSRGIEIGLPEQNTDEDTSTDGSQELHVRGLRKTDDVVEVSSGKKSPLEAPWLHSLSGFSIDFFGKRMLVTSIVAEVRVDVLVIEVFNTLLICVKDELLLLFLSASNLGSGTVLDSLLINNDILTINFLIFNLSNNGFSGHNVHEVISWVRIVGARETDAGEVFGSVDRVVVIDNLTTGDEEKLIEFIISLSVRLMDS